MPSRHDRRRQADRVPAALAEIQALFRVAPRFVTNAQAASGHNFGVHSIVEECALHSARRPAQ
ncbi:hypothetical protein [Nocardia vinacea]|uniref:hypothetical protein n=1 Tax=Nocardia vinacea TaxID=96468 RepID=UPI00031E39A3|nr:hypothetical protein [Nocardia vinacea]